MLTNEQITKRLVLASAYNQLSAFQRLQQIAYRLRRLDTAYCERDLQPHEWSLRKQYEVAADRIAQDEFGMLARHQTDPRGCTLYLVFDEGTDDLPGEGVAIYTEDKG